MGAEKRIHEEWLDAALRARANCKPRAGLEERVLARLACEPPRKALVWWPMLAAPAALVLIAIALIPIRSGERKHNLATNAPGPAILSHSQGSDSSPRAPVLKAVVKPALNLHSRSNRGRREISDSKRDELPKLATFPAAQPETPDEHLLMRLATKRGSVDVAGISNDFAPQELSIPKLKIDPMEGTPPDDTPQE